MKKEKIFANVNVKKAASCALVLLCACALSSLGCSNGKCALCSGGDSDTEKAINRSQSPEETTTAVQNAATSIQQPYASDADVVNGVDPNSNGGSSSNGSSTGAYAPQSYGAEFAETQSPYMPNAASANDVAVPEQLRQTPSEAAVTDPASGYQSYAPHDDAASSSYDLGNGAGSAETLESTSKRPADVEEAPATSPEQTPEAPAQESGNIVQLWNGGANGGVVQFKEIVQARAYEERESGYLPAPPAANATPEPRRVDGATGTGRAIGSQTSRSGYLSGAAQPKRGSRLVNGAIGTGKVIDGRKR